MVDVATIDCLTDRAYPAAERAELDGWVLRADISPHRRSRSVWPRGPGGAMGLEERLARVEAWYCDRGLPVRFQLTPASLPADLDAILAARGYDAEATAGVWVAPPAAVGGVHAGWDVTLAPAPDAAWLARTGAVPEVIGRVRARCVYATSAVAAARGVLAGGWLGIYEVVTAPDARRRGAASAIVERLVAWGAQRGAHTAYMLVLDGNAPARALYARLGFARAYGYRYRVVHPEAR